MERVLPVAAEEGCNTKCYSSENSNEAYEETRSGEFGCQIPESLEALKSRFPNLKPERQPWELRRPQNSFQDIDHHRIDVTVRLPNLSRRTIPPGYCTNTDNFIQANEMESQWRHQEYKFGCPRNSVTDHGDRSRLPSHNPPRNSLEDVPQEIRWKVRSEGIVTNYFGSEITVAKLQNDNIMEVCICHVILILNAATDQYWVKAFTKASRSQEGNVLKFSRLITRNMVPELLGNTSFVFASAHGRFERPEKYMLNFFDTSMATKFQHALREARKQVWNHAALRLQAQYDKGSRLRQSQIQREVDDFVRNPLRKAVNDKIFTRFDAEKKFESATPTWLSNNYNHIKANQFPSMERCSPLGESLQKIKIRNQRFRAEGIRLYMKVVTGAQVKNPAFALLGEGDIYIQETKGGYDHLLFFGINEELLFDHFIYPWNNPSVLQQVSEDDWECCWIAAANHLITKNPRNVPMARDFKIVAKKEITQGFKEALQRSTSQALVNRLTTLNTNVKVQAENTAYLPPGPSQDNHESDNK